MVQYDTTDGGLKKIEEALFNHSIFFVQSRLWQEYCRNGWFYRKMIQIKIVAVSILQEGFYNGMCSTNSFSKKSIFNSKTLFKAVLYDSKSTLTYCFHSATLT